MIHIWYGDGSKLSGEWADLPDDDVQFVYQELGEDEFGRPLGAIANGHDFYWIENGALKMGETSCDGSKSGKWCDTYAAIEGEFLSWLRQHII